MTTLSKWKTASFKEIRQKSAADLFNWVLEAARGDDYDGGFTKRGAWEYEIALLELRIRLHTISKENFPPVNFKEVSAEVSKDYLLLSDNEAAVASLMQALKE